MPHRRSPDAFMNACELKALRYLWRNLPRYIEKEHGELLVRMGLAKVNAEGTLEITEDGKRRFSIERNRSSLFDMMEGRAAQGRPRGAQCTNAEALLWAPIVFSAGCHPVTAPSPGQASHEQRPALVGLPARHLRS